MHSSDALTQVDELSNGLVMVTGKLNDRLTRVEGMEHERYSPSAYNSKVRGARSSSCVAGVQCCGGRGATLPWQECNGALAGVLRAVWL